MANGDLAKTSEVLQSTSSASLSERFGLPFHILNHGSKAASQGVAFDHIKSATATPQLPSSFLQDARLLANKQHMCEQ